MVGKTQEDYVATELALSSGYHGQVFKAKLAENPVVAQAYLANNRDAIDPAMLESLDVSATKTVDRRRGADILNSVYAADLTPEDINKLIEQSDGTEAQNALARQGADDQRALEIAQQKAAEHQRALA